MVKLTTKEKFTKYNKAKKDKNEKTHTGTPEIGDARRFYEKATKRHVTALIISSKETPTNKENLELAFWNLHCQMTSLQAQKAHMQLHDKSFKPVDAMTALIALERQFLDTDIAIYIWLPIRSRKQNC